jgi:hypothetical protein
VRVEYRRRCRHARDSSITLPIRTCEMHETQTPSSHSPLLVTVWGPSGHHLLIGCGGDAGGGVNDA